MNQNKSWANSPTKMQDMIPILSSRYGKDKDIVNTTKENEILRTESGEDYTGDFHIHMKTMQIMSGAIHSKDSINLYRKKNKS